MSQTNFLIGRGELLTNDIKGLKRKPGKAEVYIVACPDRHRHQRSRIARGNSSARTGTASTVGNAPDTDFARSMALMEAAREAGVYGAETEIFKGFDSLLPDKALWLGQLLQEE